MEELQLLMVKEKQAVLAVAGEIAQIHQQVALELQDKEIMEVQGHQVLLILAVVAAQTP
jgi:hypothetical protein